MSGRAAVRRAVPWVVMATVVVAVGSACASRSVPTPATFSPALLRLIPDVAEKLRSPNPSTRLSVLDELVRNWRDADMLGYVIPHELPPSDYIAVIERLLAGDLKTRFPGPSPFWGRVCHLIEAKKLRQLGGALARDLSGRDPGVQMAILRTLQAVRATEAAPQVVPLLGASQDYVRRHALATLVALGAPEAVPSLVAELEKGTEFERYHALRGLVDVAGRQAAAPIANALTDESENNREWALDALVKLDAREQAPKIWAFIEAPNRDRTKAYAIAALVAFGERRAIPLAMDSIAKRTFDGAVLNRLVELNCTQAIPALIGLLESKDVYVGPGTDSNIRSGIMWGLAILDAREAIPVLRSYVRGRDAFLRTNAATALGVLAATEAVDDLLPLLDVKMAGDTYASGHAAIALARIGDRRAWPQLLDLAADPKWPTRSEIILELNRHLDPGLWRRATAQTLRERRFDSIYTAIATYQAGGLSIVLQFKPGEDVAPPRSLDDNRYPWTTAGGGTYLYGITPMIDDLSGNRTPRTFTALFQDGRIHILSVDRATALLRGQLRRPDDRD